VNKKAGRPQSKKDFFTPGPERGRAQRPCPGFKKVFCAALFQKSGCLLASSRPLCNFLRLHQHQSRVVVDQGLGDFARREILIVDLAHWSYFRGCSGHEAFRCFGHIVQSDVAFDDLIAAGAGQGDDGAPGDAVQKTIGNWRVDFAVDDKEDIGAGYFTDIAVPGR
jgi:hypothetical protein